MAATHHRRASAVWNGSLRDGGGELTTESGVLSDTPYAFRNRFEDEPGANPEELIGAAHAGCYSMALSNILTQAGTTPERIRTSATVTFEVGSDGANITRIHLETRAKVPGADDAGFQDAAEKAKQGCPVSKALKPEITLDAALES